MDDSHAIMHYIALGMITECYAVARDRHLRTPVATTMGFVAPGPNEMCQLVAKTYQNNPEFSYGWLRDAAFIAFKSGAPIKGVTDFMERMFRHGGLPEELCVGLATRIKHDVVAKTTQ